MKKKRFCSCIGASGAARHGGRFGSVATCKGSWRYCTYYFFFFQAEDGIRHLTVTGVQTCALPISGSLEKVELLIENRGVIIVKADDHAGRSEERRVGTECSSRWAAYPKDKKI